MNVIYKWLLVILSCVSFNSESGSIEKELYTSTGVRISSKPCMCENEKPKSNDYKLAIGDYAFFVPEGYEPIGFSSLSESGIIIAFSKSENEFIVMAVYHGTDSGTSDLKDAIAALNSGSLKSLDKGSSLMIYSGLGETTLFQNGQQNEVLLLTKHGGVLGSESKVIIPEASGKGLIDFTRSPAVGCNDMMDLGAQSEGVVEQYPAWIVLLGDVLTKYLKSGEIDREKIRETGIEVIK